MFEYQDAEKRGFDAFTVMARAIRRHYDNDEEKIPPALARVMAKIIDDGFLDKTIQEQADLIAHTKRILEKTEALKRAEERKMWSAVAKTEEAIRLKAELDKRVEQLREIEEKETDPFLLGAKKAYYFILNETRDKDKASKAFDSYLQGIGKWKQYQDGKQ